METNDPSAWHGEMSMLQVARKGMAVILGRTVWTITGLLLGLTEEDAGTVLLLQV